MSSRAGADRAPAAPALGAAQEALDRGMGLARPLELRHVPAIELDVLGGG